MSRGPWESRLQEGCSEAHEDTGDGSRKPGKGPGRAEAGPVTEGPERKKPPAFRSLPVSRGTEERNGRVENQKGTGLQDCKPSASPRDKRGQEAEPAEGECGTETRLSVLLSPLSAPRKDLEVRALGHTKTLSRDEVCSSRFSSSSQGRWSSLRAPSHLSRSWEKGHVRRMVCGCGLCDR